MNEAMMLEIVKLVIAFVLSVVAGIVSNFFWEKGKQRRRQRDKEEALQTETTPDGEVKDLVLRLMEEARDFGITNQDSISSIKQSTSYFMILVIIYGLFYNQLGLFGISLIAIPLLTFAFLSWRRYKSSAKESDELKYKVYETRAHLFARIKKDNSNG